MFFLQSLIAHKLNATGHKAVMLAVLDEAVIMIPENFTAKFKSDFGVVHDLLDAKLIAEDRFDANYTFVIVRAGIFNAKVVEGCWIWRFFDCHLYLVQFCAETGIDRL